MLINILILIEFMGEEEMNVVSTMVLRGENLDDLSNKLNKELLRYSGKDILDVKILSATEAVIVFKN